MAFNFLGWLRVIIAIRPFLVRVTISDAEVMAREEDLRRLIIKNLSTTN
jgi:hypothetical protein